MAPTTRRTRSNSKAEPPQQVPAPKGKDKSTKQKVSTVKSTGKKRQRQESSADDTTDSDLEAAEKRLEKMKARVAKKKEAARKASK